jgi:hypothetical protein
VPQSRLTATPPSTEPYNNGTPGGRQPDAIDTTSAGTSSTGVRTRRDHRQTRTLIEETRTFVSIRNGFVRTCWTVAKSSGRLATAGVTSTCTTGPQLKRTRSQRPVGDPRR